MSGATKRTKAMLITAIGVEVFNIGPPEALPFRLGYLVLRLVTLSSSDCAYSRPSLP